MSPNFECLENNTLFRSYAFFAFEHVSWLVLALVWSTLDTNPKKAERDFDAERRNDLIDAQNNKLNNKDLESYVQGIFTQVTALWRL